MTQKSIFILLFTIVQYATWAQPNQFRGINRDGIYPDTGLLDEWPEEGPPLVAAINGIGDGYGSPSIDEHGFYIAGMTDSTGFISHFDHNRLLLWKVPYGKEFSFKYPGSRGTPTLEGDRLYYSGTMGDAFCMDARNGTMIWEVNIFDTYGGSQSKWGYTESPLIYNDLVILTPGGPGYNVVALDKNSGTLKWTLDLDSSINAYCSPTLIRHRGKDLIMMNTTRDLLLIHPATGEVAFRHNIAHPNDMHAINPLYLEGKVFYSSGYDEGSVLYQINDENGTLDTIYYNGDLDCKLSGLIVVDGTVFGTSDRKKQWVGLDLATGKTVFITRELKPGSFLMADEKFFIFTETGDVALALPGQKGFRIVSQFRIPADQVQLAFAHPVLYNGILYIRYRDHLWLYDVSKP
jgi:outer membrane protein assembly factor BamB